MGQHVSASDRTLLYYRLIYRTAIVILPSDGVTITRAGVSRRVGGIACNSCNGRCPACEGVGKLSCSRSGGVSMCWCLAFYDYRLVN